MTPRVGWYCETGYLPKASDLVGAIQEATETLSHLEARECMERGMQWVDAVTAKHGSCYDTQTQWQMLFGASVVHNVMRFK
jgi:flavin-binding protein dodecin